MRNKEVKLSILALAILIVVIFVFLFYIVELEKEEELTPEFLEWINSTAKIHDFEHPYVQCISKGTCNGTFYLRIDVGIEENITEIEEILNEYGIVAHVFEVESLNEYSISFEIDDLYKVNDFFNSPFIKEINLESILSDYKINISLNEIKKCGTYEECIIVKNSCCGCGSESINKKYIDLWNTRFYCHGIGCVAVACGLDSYPACEENVCVLKNKMNCNVDNDCVSSVGGCINKNFADRFNYTLTDTFECECKEEKLCVEIQEESLIVNIILPINNVNISTESINITATTDREAVCEYSKKVIFPNSGAMSKSKQMNITNGILHSQIIENLQNGGSYTITLNCTNELGNSVTDSVHFWSRISEYYNLSGKFIGETVPSPHLTDTQFPILLKDDFFEYSTGVEVAYMQQLFINDANIENSTSGGDLKSPRVLIEVGTDYNNYLYKYEVIFSKAVNFTKRESIDWWIQLLGDNYKIVDGSTNQKIILDKYFSNDDFILEDEQPLKINEEIINGTYVDIDNRDLGVTRIETYFAMQDSNKDYIAAGEYYDNPFFQNIRYSFRSYSTENGAEVYFGQGI